MAHIIPSASFLLTDYFLNEYDISDDKELPYDVRMKQAYVDQMQAKEANKILSITKAAKQHEVAKSTLMNRIKKETKPAIISR